MEPGFEHKVLSEENGIITEIGCDGVVSRWSWEGHSTQQFIRFPVENRENYFIGKLMPVVFRLPILIPARCDDSFANSYPIMGFFPIISS